MSWLPNPSLLMKGRLARRTFALLLIAAFIPIFIATWLIVGHTDAYVDRKAHQTLTLETKKYGLAVFQRLELASTALAATPAAPSAPDANTPLPATLQAYFRSVTLVRNDPEISATDSLQNSMVISGALPAAGETAVRIIRDENGTNAVALIHAEDERRWRVGVLEHDYLWQPAALAGELFVRVSDGNGQVLFASLPERHQSVSAEEGDTAEWELFLQQRFAAGKWRVSMLEPHSDVKREFTRYKRTLLYTLIPLIAALILFASIFIRRTHRPLEVLIDATHRIASGDFSGRVVSSGDQDIRSLTEAFNAMTQQIGRQFETLAVQSQLDGHILRSSDLDEIVQTVLRHARGLLNCDQLAILLLDEDCSDIARIHIARYADNAIQYKARVQLSGELQTALCEAKDKIAFDAKDAAFPHLQELTSDWQPDRVFKVLPIRTDKGVQGGLLLTGSTSRPPERAAIDIARGLAERMAVAISNANRQTALVRQAHYDSLTQLPNRVLFKDRLAQQIAHCQRSRGKFALLFIDLDRFKNINDSFGHTSGDELLKGVATRLIEELPGVATIARLGGDEFTIITSDVESASDAANAAQSVIAALARPVLLGEIEHFVSASIGIAIYPQDGVTTDVLLRNADIAMYRAKAAGTGRFAYYEEAMNREAMERVELENDLRHALTRDELFVVYQPRIDLRDEKIIGVEALSRWRHPRFGMVPPDRFIHIAEDSGLILAIGDRVLREICEQYQRWRAQGIELQRLAYNVSVRQLQAPGFTKTIQDITQRWQIPRGVLEIEITESVLATDIDYLASVLLELNEMGVQIAIDDFGTGYSSLSYLRLLPIDTLKIDRAFLPPPTDPQAPAALCEAILAMSKALNLMTVAEGVETAQQAQFLRRNGCNIVQGFYFSRPILAEEISQKYGRISSDELRSATA